MTAERTASGAKTLNGEYFTSTDVYEQETRRVFRRHWICVGRVSEIPDEGDFFLTEFEGESLIVTRDGEGRVRCFFNVCRHRGTRLCEVNRGQFNRRIQCAYHAWSYDLSGRLRGAPNMKDSPGFDTSDYPLRSVACETWQGFVLINLDPNAKPLAEEYETMLSRFDDWELASLISAKQVTYDVSANWKLLFHNYSECYHCSNVHPQLNPVTSVESASNDFEEGLFLGGPMILADDHETIANEGRYCGRPFPKLSRQDQRRAYFYTLFPTMFISPHPDYVMTHRLVRSGIRTTRIVCDWLFPADVAEQASFDATRAVDFWDLTNRQDWRICELTQRGVESAAYEPGPYSNLESVLAAFDRYYLQTMNVE